MAVRCRDRKTTLYYCPLYMPCWGNSHQNRRHSRRHVKCASNNTAHVGVLLLCWGKVAQTSPVQIHCFDQPRIPGLLVLVRWSWAMVVCCHGRSIVEQVQRLLTGFSSVLRPAHQRTRHGLLIILVNKRQVCWGAIFR